MMKKQPPIDFRRRFIRLVVGTETFMKKHELEPFMGSCATCKAPLEASVPYVWHIDGKTHRGMCAPQCACGSWAGPFSIDGMFRS